MTVRITALLAAVTALAACDASSVDHDFFFATEGAELRVEVRGNLASRKALLMLHGGPQGHAHVYRSGTWDDTLEERYAMVFFDQRGQGGSHGRFPREQVTAEQLTRDTANLTRFLKARYGDDLEIWYLGHSWGGALGTMTLLDGGIQPEVAGWIEASGCHDDRDGLGYALQMFQEIGDGEIAANRNVAEWEQIQAEVAGIDPEAAQDFDTLVTVNQAAYRAEGLIETIASPASGAGDLWTQLAATPIRRTTANWSGRFTLLDAKYELAELSFAPRLGEISVPSLFLYGDYDFVCPPGLGADAAEAVSGPSAFVNFEASGHSVMINEPEAFTSAILDFVDTHGG